MRLPPGEFLRRWQSGEVYRLAAQVRSAAELAEKLGLSPDALVSQMQRLRRAGHDIPTLTEIIEFARTSGVWSEAAAEEDWEVEPTSPDLSNVIHGAVAQNDRASDEGQVGDGDRVEHLVSNQQHVGGTRQPASPYPESGYPAGSEVDGDWLYTGQARAGKRPEVQFKFQGSEPKVPDQQERSPTVKVRAEEEIEAVEQHRLKRKVAELEAENRRLMDEVLNTRDLLGVAREAASYRVAPLEMRERRSGRREAASLIMISDNHVDEVVEAASVNGLNEHNPDIARARMARTFEGGRWLTNHSRQSHLVRDAIVWLGGDHISGTIHQDLTETNAMSLPESIAFAQQLIGDGLRHLLQDPETETIRVICSTGNHGRLAPGKPRIHTRNETNAETILFVALAREFIGEPRISFDLPTGVFTYFQVYGRWCRASHGDHLKYGGALGGLTNPINRAVARMNQARPASLDLFAHWHTYTDSGSWIVNGATVGYGPFSEWIHCPYERPQQAWALLDSRRWRSLSAPIWSDEMEDAKEAA